MEKIRRYTIAQGVAIVLSLIMAFTIFPMTASAETGNDDAGNPAADKEAARNYVQGQIIVVTEHSTNKRQMTSIAKAADGQVDTISALGDGSNIALVEVKEGGEMDAITALESEDKVLFAQPNYIYEWEETDAAFEEPAADEPDTGETELRSDSDYPNDPLYGEQDYLAAPLEDGSNAGTINAKGAWDQLADLETTSKPLVAVIDSGARLDHEDLREVIDQNKCVTYNDGMQRDFKFGDNSDDEIDDSIDTGHGTCVTGIIGATANNGKGVTGVAGNHVDMFVIDAKTNGKGFQGVDIAQGIFYATDEGARLINISTGCYGTDYLCERALKYAWDKGTLCVCSAGNGSTPYIHYPSDSPYAIAVMAHEWNGDPVVVNDNYGTNYGVDKDVSAPGRNLMTTSHTANNQYRKFNMTSSATPVTAGSAALLLAADPNLTNREIKNLLFTSTGQESFSAEKEGQGFGRIDVNKAMENLLADKTAPEKIVINKPVIKMYEGTETSFEYAVYPGNADLSDLKIRSSNEKVAVINDDGVISAGSPGVSTIKIDCGGIYTTCNVTVEEAPPYKIIHKKPYVVKDNFKREEMMDYFDEVNSNGVLTDGRGGYYHMYRVELKENEKICAVMTIGAGIAVLRVRSEDGKSLAFDREDYPDKPYAKVEFTAKKAGSYQIQVLWGNPDGINLETNYTLKLLSNKSFCEPAVDSIDNGEMHMSWPAVDNANGYYVRKYADKDLTKLEFEDKISKTEYTDAAFDKDKVNYYTVTSYLKTQAGDLCNGETPLVVKMRNPMTAKAKKKTVKVKAKKLKKKSVKIKRTKYLKITNAKGKLTYTKVKGKKKITVSKKTGKLKIKKGLKKGKYTVKVKVRDAGNEEYGAITRTVTFKVRVR